MIRAVERALSIFDAFDAENPTLTLQGIGARIGLSKATTHRLVNSLNASGYLVRVGNHKYSLSLKFVRLGGLVRSTLTVRDIARPVMAEIAEVTGETIALNTVSGNERICIEVIETPAALMHIVKAGEHVPLVSGATGKILLAHMDEKEVEKILRSTKVGRSINRKTFFAQLRKFRKQGYSQTSGERGVGVTGIAVPLFGVDGTVKDCLSLSGPAIRLDPRLDELTKLMVKAGASVSNMLGGKRP